MPITFSVTCDTDEELARFLENLRFREENAAASKKSALASQLDTPKATAEQEKSEKPSQKSGLSRVAESNPKKGKAAKEKAVKSGKATKAGRKPGKLTPIIESAIQEMIKKGKAFRSREVTELIMKKVPDLNESSVTTGVSKLLGESTLKFDQIKDAVGRPYKLYKP